MYRSMVALLLCAICNIGCTIQTDAETGAGAKAAALPTGRRPAPAPPGGTHTHVYTWNSADAVYDFDGFTHYGENLIDGDALTVDIPGVSPGDIVSVYLEGAPYAEHSEAGVRCLLKAHMIENGVERPFSVDGELSFELSTDENIVSLSGRVDADADGVARVRILGRVTRPDRFCGLMGNIGMLVVHEDI